MERERRILQRTVAVAAVVPVLAGLYGVLFGIDGIGGGTPVNVSADSHFRYLSGLLTGIGILFLTCVPGIEDKSRLFRFLTLVVVLGGLARLLGLSLTGVPSLTMLAALALELVVTPLLCLWQMRVARLARDRRQALEPGLEVVQRVGRRGGPTGRVRASACSTQSTAGCPSPPPGPSPSGSGSP